MTESLNQQQLNKQFPLCWIGTTLAHEHILDATIERTVVKMISLKIPKNDLGKRTNTKLKKNAENSKTETRLCIVTPAHTVHSYEIVKDNKGGYYDGVAPGLLFHCSSKLHHPDDRCCCCVLTYHSSWGLIHIFCLLSSGACADLIFVIFLHKYNFGLIFLLISAVHCLMAE